MSTDPELEEFTALTFRIAKAIREAAPGIQFLVVVCDGELVNMAGNVNDMNHARNLLSNAQEQLALQGLGLPDDSRAS